MIQSNEYTLEIVKEIIGNTIKSLEDEVVGLKETIAKLEKVKVDNE